MKKITFAVLGIATLAVMFSFSAVGAINEGKKDAFNAYKKFESAGNNKTKTPQKNNVNESHLSDYSIDSAHLPDSEAIKSFKGSSITDLLVPSDEKLWFIMEGDKAKGIVIATDTEPIQAGLEKTGPELYEMYKDIIQEYGKDVQVKYLDYAGGFIFVAVDPNGNEGIWLEERAAKLLDLSPGTKYSSEQVLESINDGLNSSDEDVSDDDSLGGGK
ncbi:MULTISPECIES: hypothetical protein [Brevibacillus]|jgi:hypothetical protein|uniref:Uncharacterized protein n=1 Tax=Brevibacillus borstelensis AK1 TaxID=1300222 RepID=M8E5U4_9BACL|nr:hypothetical protein [Brevibacillus borstelensis]EMT50845.1 hypothetical protein I532_21071 [Brevibacillus borstelensis AK1]KKX55850.1 hypothetical protein X546_09415 [Brevibacillus borstelensis cifa_chp40]MBE5396604.1 hypothetical protein [Brevibacillus borstelensis]MCC0567488.1 hypothetical protein [Brevibacillus borstelensis]MCM3561897.1 hypothetical protein [Brevibacillus borstelensis]